MSHKGFTLIELVMVIVIIGILAVIAIPRFVDLAADARLAAEQGVVGGVRAGVYTAYARDRAFPAGLGACPNCFITVLSQPVTSDWTGNGTVFTGPTGATYTYTPADGQFVCTANCP